jgi:hypothetical protein
MAPASATGILILACHGMEKLGQGLQRQHAVALGQLVQQRDGLLVAHAGIGIDAVDEDVGVDAEAIRHRGQRSWNSSRSARRPPKW